MKHTILVTLALVLATISAQAVNGSDPVADAYQKVQNDLATLAQAQKDVQALSKANERLAASQAALVASKAALVAAIDAASSNVPIVPPVAKVVRLVVISSENCLACRALEPVIAKLRTEGILIETTKDAADAVKYNVKVFPTLIMVVDDVGVSRSDGSQTEAAIRTWYNETIQWSKKK